MIPTSAVFPRKAGQVMGKSWKTNLSQMITEREQGKQEKGERRPRVCRILAKMAMLRKVRGCWKWNLIMGKLGNC